ncbi:MAG: replicative DNA helicase [Hydrogenobaculum sp.]
MNNTDELLNKNSIFDIDLPRDEAAERSVLGAMLYDIENIPIVAEILKEDDFFEPIHRTLFKLLLEYYFENANLSTIDRVILKDFIEKKKITDITEDFLEALVLEAVTDIEILQSVIKIIKEKAIQRAIINLGIKIIRETKQTQDSNILIETIQSELINIASDNINVGYFELKDILENVISIIEKFAHKKELVTGVPTGFIDLDKLTTGFHESDLVIIAARPGMGKSSFMLSMMHNMAKKDIAVGIFSLEMSKEQLIMRLLSSASKIDMQRLRTGMVTDEEIKLLNSTKEELSKLKIYIDDSPAISISDLRIKARKLVREKDVKIIAIDYLQLVRSIRAKGNRQEEVAEVSRNLKALAKELKIPVIALAQLSRQTEHRSDKRPQLSDLRESGQIEQDADLILFLHRPEYYKKNPLPEEKGLVEVIIAKQRQGPTGIVRLAFISDFASFYQLSEKAASLYSKYEDEDNGLTEDSDIVDTDIDLDVDF